MWQDNELEEALTWGEQGLGQLTPEKKVSWWWALASHMGLLLQLGPLQKRCGQQFAVMKRRL